MIHKIFKNPITRMRISRFKEIKRAYISLGILIIFYVISLCSELVCNDIPLYVRFNGKSYFPAVKFYPEDLFAGNNKQTRPDYKSINRSAAFRKDTGNFMIFPLVQFSPFESIDPESIAVSDNVTLVFTAMPMIGTVNIRKDYSIVRSASFGFFINMKDKQAKGVFLPVYYNIPESIKHGIEKRFANENAQRLISSKVMGNNGIEVVISLSTYFSRKSAPESVRLTFRKAMAKHQSVEKIVFDKNLKPVQNKIKQNSVNIWNSLTAQDRKTLLTIVKERFLHTIDPFVLKVKNRPYSISFEKDDIRFPFIPVKEHLMGIDGAGRDVLARILYGLRTSLTFGLMLVTCSMILGIIAGAVQGYYGGAMDITGQRFIEIWSALPFLYIMILMGSIYGRSFSLLLFCYGLFNWIGISYYIRAEFLRLRKKEFVEAAKCMGVSSYKIIFKHILPNAMVPVITFFPFSLVGAIGTLAALDYLGFGLPPPTPSWGELLLQAQQYRWAWWLILYPSLALFVVMLLGVFVGDGIRNAYDPKRSSRLE
ncbi:MAG: ABC transporter permease subunit [Desulfobacterales bacterium]|nr:ABC transporter permease subunit [Desulfobacterales bacterium]